MLRATVSHVRPTVWTAALVQTMGLAMVHVGHVMLLSTTLLVLSAWVHTANVPRTSIQDMSEINEPAGVTS